METQCICDEFSPFDGFKCANCNKFQHWKCYHYDLTDKQPEKMRCLKCTLDAYDPFQKIIQFIQLSTKKNHYWVKKGTTLEKITLSFQLEKNHFESVLAKKQSIAIIWLKISDNKKFYEWPSKNIYLELNQQHHLIYEIGEYIKVQPQLLQKLNILSITMREPFEYSSILSIGLIQDQSLNMLQAQIIDVGREKVVQKQIDDLKLKYANKMKQIEKYLNDEEISQDHNLQIKLIDGLTLQQLEIPVRGKDCLHFDCFELIPFLQFNKIPNSSRWKCPYCNNLVPVDSLVIDYVQLEILYDLKKKYPQFSNQITRIAIVNKLLDITLIDEHQLQLKKQQDNLFHNSKTFTDCVKVRKDNFQKQTDKFPSLFQILQEYLKKDQEQNKQLILTIKSAKKLLRLYNQKNILKQVQKNSVQLIEFFVNLFDCSEYLNHNIFDEMEYLDSFVCLELLCKAINQQTISGLFCKYIQLFNPTIQEAGKAILLFAFETNLKMEKILELIFAYSYQQNKQYSPGLIIKQFFDFFFKTKPEIQIQLQKLTKLFPKIFYQMECSNIFVVKNCQIISDLLLDVDIVCIKDMYPLQLTQNNKQTKLILTLILSLINQKNNHQNQHTIYRGFNQMIGVQFQEYELEEQKQIVEQMDTKLIVYHYK